MTDYAIRINLQNDQHLKTIQTIIQNPKITTYLIGNVELPQTNPHIHIYIQTTYSRDSLVKMMKRNSVIFTGNKSYSIKPITQTIPLYQRYCIKTIEPDNIPISHNLKYLTNLTLESIQGLPEWQDLKKLTKQKSETFKQHLLKKLTYLYPNTTQLHQKTIFTFLMKELKIEHKTFTKHTISMYMNYLTLQTMDIDYDHMYKELFFNDYTGTYKQFI